jgi:hypothetical protein
MDKSRSQFDDRNELSEIDGNASRLNRTENHRDRDIRLDQSQGVDQNRSYRDQDRAGGLGEQGK